MRNDRGFTIIELVVVIAILGILAAVAMPKFASLEAKARTAAFDGVKGGFTAAIQIAHSKWLGDGSVANQSVTLEGATICMNASGWPTLDPNNACTGPPDQGTADGLYAALMTGSRPTKFTTGITAPTNVRYCLAGTGGGEFTYTTATGAVADGGTCP